jgi:predicted porin
MKKSAVALAVGAAVAAPAIAQESTVQIYGKVYPEFLSTEAKGATGPGGVTSNLVPQVTTTGNDHKQRFAVDTQNSYLGFRGEEKLGGNLAAIWQIEQSLGFDTGDNGFWANRNSFVGLRSNFGTVKLGNMDTIYKEFGDQFSMFGLNSGNFTSASNTLSHIGMGTVRQGRFHERAPNSVQYLSPEFSDIQLGIQYSADELKGNPGNNLNAYNLSYGIKYDSKRFYLSLHQEKHNDFFGGSRNADPAIANSFAVGTTSHSKDTGTRFSAVFKFTPDHMFTFDIARLEYTESGQTANGRFEKYERTNWTVGWEARWGGGPVRTGIQYVNMNEGKCSLSGGVGCTTTGLDGNHISLGTAYDLSKRTFIFALASKLTNGESARFDNWANGDANRGADLTQWALGVQHRF